ncbi:NAD(P)-binding protein [Auricularia subglabra TFB-10046 SS5]|nr:NAD(P)-binding protein [Auricularia subglabra TFB-10046 SS5]
MSAQKLVTVSGATGSSGGSVAKYLLDDGAFAVRAITRNAGSPVAQALKERGAEVVVADLDKPETLPAAVRCSYGVVGVTDFWSIFVNTADAEKSQQAEYEQGKALVDAAKEADVKHFVLFSAPRCDVAHCDNRDAINEYLKSRGVSRTTFYNPFYFETLVNPFMVMRGWQAVKKEGDGSLVLGLSIPEDTYLPSYSNDQAGAWILTVFKNPSDWIGKEIFPIAEHNTPKTFAAVMSKALGKEVKAKPLLREDFFKLADDPNPFVHEVFLAMKFCYDTQPPNSNYDEAVSRKIFPGAHTFEEFVQHNDKFKKFSEQYK